MSTLSPESLGRLIDTHAASLELYAAQWTDVAADVVQEAFVELVKVPEAPDRIVPWLYRVVRHRALNAARAANRRRRYESQAAAMARCWFEPSAGSAIEAEEATAALRTLPVEQREVIVARLWGDLSFEEISAVAGVSASTAFRRYQSGIATLRKRLTATWLTNNTTQES